MKEKIFAVIMITLIAGAVTTNTLLLRKNIDKIHASVDEIEITDEEWESSKQCASEAFELFKAKELFIGLTVNHDDLSDIEGCFSELIGYLDVGDTSGASVAKNRLIDALGHLRRLSGFNIDAII